jgi:hypothetical protein
MKQFLFILLLLAGGKAIAAPLYCEELKLQFDKKIKTQVEKGIPFDLVVLMRSPSGTSCKTVINIRYDLWNEVVRFAKNGQASGPETLTSARQTLCQWAQCPEVKPAAPNSPVKVRLLMNPLWEGQSKALIRTKQNSIIRFFKLEWDELSQELPKDLEIMNQDVQL